MLDDLSSYQDFYSKPSTQEKPLSVTDLTLQIKGLLESTIGVIWVRGELSNFKCAPSGHAYFSLKDESTVISAAVFGWKKMLQSSPKLKSLNMQDGTEVLCRARISVYAPRGTYQIIIDRIEDLGQGSLQALFEKMKKKLEIDGLFDQSHKKELPKFPKKIAVITSPSGAAIQDILNVLKRRAPQIEIFIVPVLVQGEKAEAELTQAVERIGSCTDLYDLILLTRGGGSQEDLWCFNSEKLAHAIFKSSLPVISAVGHEIDFTISDFVADLRAPTPSAGAEILSEHWVEVAERVSEIQQRLHLLMENKIHSYKNQCQRLMALLVSPKDKVLEAMQKCDESLLRLESAMKRRLDSSELSFMQAISKLEALSPLRVLERGYTIVQDDSGDKARIIKSSGELKSGQKYILQFNDGKKTVEAL